MIKIIALALMIFAAHAKPQSNGSRTIADNPTVCYPEFEGKNPKLAAATELVREATVEVDCPGFRANGIILDTPSRRLLLTVEHLAVHVNISKSGKRTLGKYHDPLKTCTVLDPKTQKLYPLDKTIAPALGHPLDHDMNYQREDWMLLVLKTPIATRRPLAMMDIYHFEDEMDLIHTGGLGVIGRNGKRCFNATLCHSQWHEGRLHDPSYLRTDCSSGEGNCGGAAVTLDQNGQPMLVGIDTGTSENVVDGLPYDPDKNWEGVLTLSALLRDRIDQMETAVASGKPTP